MHISTAVEATAAILTVLGTIIGMGYAVGSKLEKISSSLDRMGDHLAGVVSRVDDHEQRLRDLEN